MTGSMAIRVGQQRTSSVIYGSTHYARTIRGALISPNHAQLGDPLENLYAFNVIVWAPSKRRGFDYMICRTINSTHM